MTRGRADDSLGRVEVEDATVGGTTVEQMGDRLKWLLLATHVPSGGQGGGIVRYTVEVARALAARPDVDLRVLTTPQSATVLRELTGAEVLTTRALPRLAMSIAERHLAGPAVSGADVVHGVKHLLPFRTSRATSVLTAHDMLLVDRAGDFDRAKQLLLTGPYRRSLEQASVVACVSAATRDRVAALAPRAAAACTVVPLATSSSLRSAVPRPVDALVGKSFALVVGDPSPRKNLPLLVDNWRRVRKAHPSAVLAVVGPDSWGDTVFGSTFDQLVAEGALVRLSNLPDAGLRWSYENCAVVLCPSLAEGFGLPAAEAMDFGAPLITSTDRALVEVSGDGVAHLDPHDADAWVDEVSRAFRAGRSTNRVVPAARRSWDDVAAETVVAVRAVRAGR